MGWTRRRWDACAGGKWSPPTCGGCVTRSRVDADLDGLDLNTATAWRQVWRVAPPMADDRYAQVRRTLVDGGTAERSLDEVCRRCATFLRVDGATIVLLVDHAQAAVAASNDR